MNITSIVLGLLAAFVASNAFAASSVVGCKAVAIKTALSAARQPGNAQTRTPNPSFVSIDQDEDDPNSFTVTVSQDEECLASYAVTTKTKSTRSRKGAPKCQATSVKQTDIDCG